MKKDKLKDFMYQYQIKSEVLKKVTITKNKIITVDTIKVFQALHPDFGNIYAKSIKSALQRIYKNDKVINFKRIKIYYHTYRIIFLIYQYTQISNFYQSDKYKKYSFAKHKSAKTKFKRDYKKNKKEAYDKSNSYTGDNKVHALALRKYFWHRGAMDIYFNAITLFPKNNINYEILKETEEADRTIMNIINKIQEYYSSSYIDTEDVIYESLAIIINGYFRLKMGINSKISNSITNELLSALFYYEVEKSSSDRLSNIYIAGRINNMPIFKNSTTVDIYSKEDKEKFIGLLEEAKQDFNILVDSDKYFISNPLKAFFEQYPMEFLSKVK